MTKLTYEIFILVFIICPFKSPKKTGKIGRWWKRRNGGRKAAKRRRRRGRRKRKEKKGGRGEKGRREETPKKEWNILPPIWKTLGKEVFDMLKVRC